MPKQERDVQETSAKTAWLISTDDFVPGQELIDPEELFLRQEDAYTLGCVQPPAVPGQRIWEVRAYGDLEYRDHDLRGNPDASEEAPTVPVVRATKARVLRRVWPQ